MGQLVGDSGPCTASRRPSRKGGTEGVVQRRDTQAALARSACMDSTAKPSASSGCCSWRGLRTAAAAQAPGRHSMACGAVAGAARPAAGMAAACCWCPASLLTPPAGIPWPAARRRLRVAAPPAPALSQSPSPLSPAPWPPGPPPAAAPAERVGRAGRRVGQRVMLITGLSLGRQAHHCCCASASLWV